MAKRKTQIDKAIAELDDKIKAVVIERDHGFASFDHKIQVLHECRAVLVATKAAHATLKTPKIAKVMKAS